MNAIDQVLKANYSYAETFDLISLNIQPTRELAVVACMDARINVEELLGLKTGDAHIIRNAGGVVTEDALRSLIISHHLLGTKEIMLIHHTECGMLSFRDEEFKGKLWQTTHAAAVAPEYFHTFNDLDGDVTRQIQKLKSHPWLSNDLSIRGFVYDVRTGKLREVSN